MLCTARKLTLGACLVCSPPPPGLPRAPLGLLRSDWGTQKAKAIEGLSKQSRNKKKERFIWVVMYHLDGGMYMRCPPPPPYTSCVPTPPAHSDLPW